jgi:hypothetical protein
MAFGVERRGNQKTKAQGKEGKRGQEGRKTERTKAQETGGTEPPHDDLPESIDWGRLRSEALQMYSRRGGGRGWVEDAVQAVIASLLAKFAAGEEPRTQEGLRAALERGVRNKLSSWGRQERNRRRKLEMHATLVAARNLFDTPRPRHEQQALFARIFEKLKGDVEATMLLACLMRYEVSFGETRLLTKILGIPPVRVTNAKRRLLRAGANVLKEITGKENPKGNARGRRRRGGRK